MADGGGLDERAREFVAAAGDAEAFAERDVPRHLVDEIIEAATAWRPTRFGAPPWRVMVVVGDERERLVSRVAEALARHWGLGTAGPRGLASEAVLHAPVLVLVFSTVPASESVEAFGLVAGAVQSMILLAYFAGLAGHRIFGAHVVPEAALDYAAEFLGPEVRGGELVTLLALGWPTETSRRPAGRGLRPTWVGAGEAPTPPEIAIAASELRPPAPLLRSPHRERVLVVDPYPYNRALLEAQLVRAGYSVEVFADGQAVHERIVSGGGQPHLLVVSDTLPDTSGLELVRRLRRAPLNVRAPVIMSTVRRDSAFRIAGLSAGADYYLRKPVNAVELYTAARILLDRHRLVEDLRRANAELERLIGEVRTAQARLVQHAKMAALGQLVAGVAHEINTPLAAVVSNNDLFLRCFDRLRASLRQAPVSLEDRSTVERDLSAVEDLTRVTREACARITGIVRTLRTFARLDEAEVKLVDLHEGIESTLVLVAHLLKGGIAVERRYGKLPRVECHPNQLNQVFMNLIVNACQAMGDSGRLTIDTRLTGDEAEIEITDTGVGIPPERLERIFDPGFTTKGPTLGTGLGLSIVYQIVSGHGGEVLVESEVGRGTTFTVRLPVRHVRPADDAAPPRP